MAEGKRQARDTERQRGRAVSPLRGPPTRLLPVPIPPLVIPGSVCVTVSIASISSLLV